MASNAKRKLLPLSSNGRSCVGCTKCCEGWLTATIDNEPMYPGRPCKFVQIGRGCSSYDTRPQKPCVEFRCEWLTNDSIPEWMKPSSSGVIITNRLMNDIPFFDLTGTGEGIDEDVLSWFVLWALGNNSNIRWRNRHGSQYRLGSKEFNDAAAIAG